MESFAPIRTSMRYWFTTIRKFQEIYAEFEMDIRTGDEELPYMGLCQILSNGLENAWDALKALAVEKRKVSVQMKYNRDYLIIRIKKLLPERSCGWKRGKSVGSEQGRKRTWIWASYGVRDGKTARRRI